MIVIVIRIIIVITIIKVIIILLLSFQMDVEAIAQASDNKLLLMGLDKKGDMLSLKKLI